MATSLKNAASWEFILHPLFEEEGQDGYVDDNHNIEDDANVYYADSRDKTVMASLT